MAADVVIADLVAGIDWAKPDNVENGRRTFNVRCRVPFTVPSGSVTARTLGISNNSNAISLDDVIAETGVDLQSRGIEDLGHTGDGGGARVFEDDGDGIVLPDSATGDSGSDDEEVMRDILVSGISSSTSIDHYGTEMSLRALKLMAIQMMSDSGVPYLPNHFSAAGAVEWDEVIGRTVHAEIVPAETVAKPFNEAESQFMLRTTIKLYGDEEKAKALIRRISRGEKIGQSVGGWFTHLQVVQNEDGDVDRVIVQGVELDHLAVTRAPANPDSIGIVHLRSTLQASASQWLERRKEHEAYVDAVCNILSMNGSYTMTDGRSCPAGRADAMATDVAARLGVQRHVVVAQDNGDGTVTLVLEIADDNSANKTAGDNRCTADLSVDKIDVSVSPETGDHLDNNVGTAQDTGIDARRSAPTDFESTPSARADTPSEEYAMTDEDLQKLQAFLSKGISDATAPLIERVAKLEDVRAEQSLPAEPVAATPLIVLPADDDRIAEAQRDRDAAIARAKAAEEALAEANRRPMRVGRSVTPSIAGRAGVGAANQLVERSRVSAPQLAAVAERCIEEITDAPVPGTTVTRSALDSALRGLLVAAEADGIITDPSHRAAWQ